MWQVPSGHGKSRIEHFVAVIGFVLEIFDTIHILYNNEDLMKRDVEMFNEYWLLLDIQDKVKYHYEMFKPKKGELLIVDEADEFVLMKPKEFVQMI